MRRKPHVAVEIPRVQLQNRGLRRRMLLYEPRVRVQLPALVLGLEPYRVPPQLCTALVGKPLRCVVQRTRAYWWQVAEVQEVVALPVVSRQYGNGHERFHYGCMYPVQYHRQLIRVPRVVHEMVDYPWEVAVQPARGVVLKLPEAVYDIRPSHWVTHVRRVVWIAEVSVVHELEMPCEPVRRTLPAGGQITNDVHVDVIAHQVAVAEEYQQIL